MTTPAPLLWIGTGPVAGWTVVTVRGELDYASCPELTGQLDAVIDGQQHSRVALDLSGLDFCDSSGLRCLVAAWRRIQDRDGELLILKPPPPLRRKIMVTGLDAMLWISDELPRLAGRCRMSC